MTIRFVCGWCGSSDVSRDAWADPDIEKQAWVLRVRRRLLPDVRMPARTGGGGAISPLPLAGEECDGRSCPRHDLKDAGGILHRRAGEGLLLLPRRRQQKKTLTLPSLTRRNPPVRRSIMPPA